jgi:hypothetical protein
VAEVETKLVGKMDEKVVMTVEAEAETKLPVEEVVEAVEEMDKEVAEAAIANAETELEHTVDAKTGTISVAGDIADSNADDDIVALMEGLNALGGSDVVRAEQLEKKEPVLVVRTKKLQKLLLLMLRLSWNILLTPRQGQSQLLVILLIAMPMMISANLWKE